MRHFVIYLCHACGWIQGEEEDNLACAQCGEPRSMVESVEVAELPRDVVEGPGDPGMSEWLAA